jgi:DNA-binding SARP family transcriptional activator
VGTLLDHVDTVLVERSAGQADHEELVQPMPVGGQTSNGPLFLVAIDGLECLLADPLLVSRVDTLCRHGAASGICIVATTDDVPALAAEGALLDAFASRVAFRLTDADQSRHILGKEGAEQLPPGEVLWIPGSDAPERLHTLALSSADAREVLGAIATAHQPGPPLHVVDPPDDADHDVISDEGTRDAEECGSSGGEQDAPALIPALPAAPAVAGMGPPPEQDTLQNEGMTTPDGALVAITSSAPELGGAGDGPVVPAATASVGARQMSVAAERPSSAGDRREGDKARRAPIMLRLFGGIQIELVGSVGTARGVVLPRQQQELLAFLALQSGQTASRDRIAEAFWPDEDPAVSLNRFHRMLRKLREGLAGPLRVAVDGAAVQQRSSDYQLQPGLVWVDAVAFEEALTQAAVAVDAERAGLLQDAVDLYASDLFGDRMPDWAQNLMWHLRERYLGAMRDLSKWYEAQGDLAQALAMTVRLSEAEPTREAFHRRVMRLQAQTGDLEAIQRQYAHLCAILQAELGAQPEERTQQLYRRLRTPDGNTQAVSSNVQMLRYQIP